MHRAQVTAKFNNLTFKHADKMKNGSQNATQMASRKPQKTYMSFRRIVHDPLVENQKNQVTKNTKQK